MLDVVFSHLLQQPRIDDALNLGIAVSPVPTESGHDLVRLSIRYRPPPETMRTDERDIELVAVGENAEGRRTDPVRWIGKARLSEVEGIFRTAVDLRVDGGFPVWSVALRDRATGLVAYSVWRGLPLGSRVPRARER